ncbi:hypothetical protein TcWFU_007588 [Taenia crassiceps]|uniref:Uncharacterized protein n=1 Tax=Taenia crassiceps TaxID=6207 RepID=A0ABR4Q4B6_9CEST
MSKKKMGKNQGDRIDEEEENEESFVMKSESGQCAGSGFGVGDDLDILAGGLAAAIQAGCVPTVGGIVHRPPIRVLATTFFLAGTTRAAVRRKPSVNCDGERLLHRDIEGVEFVAMKQD